jgi:hypothetical protein
MDLQIDWHFVLLERLPQKNLFHALILYQQGTIDMGNGIVLVHQSSARSEAIDCVRRSGKEFQAII